MTTAGPKELGEKRNAAEVDTDSLSLILESVWLKQIMVT